MANISEEEEQRREGIVALAKLEILGTLQRAEKSYDKGSRAGAYRNTRIHARIVEEALGLFAKPAGRKPKAKAEAAT